VSRRWFWPLITVGTISAALGAAFLGFAVANRDYAKPTETAGWTNYVPLAASDNEPLPWLVAGVALLVVAFVPFLIATRHR
jgi:hypothetical protein